jgi:membrane protein DedA with SNARE-associated domain
MLAAGVMLAAATLVSEDAATLTAGVLVAAKAMPATAAVAWVAFGIWAGDVGLFAVGRLARRVPVVTRWVDRRWSIERVQAMETQLSRGLPLAVLGSRFLPGTRVALYVAAGLLEQRASTFATCAAVASIAWSTTVVLTVGSMGALW